MREKKSWFMRPWGTVLLCLFAAATSRGQALEVVKIDAPMVVDGLLTEPGWTATEGLSVFYQFEPQYGQAASYATVVKVLLGPRHLYASFDCADPRPSRIIGKVTQRDGNVEADDVVALMLDTFGDGSNGYLFIVNALGTQKDGLLADNGRTEDFQWDESWQSACTVHDKGWTAELAIPLKSLKFDPAKTVWGFNAARHVPHLQETVLLAREMVNPYRVSQFGRLTGLDLSDLSLKKVTLMPYVQMQARESTHPHWEAGLGVRYRPVSQLSVEATVNPDFATIEADVEQVNLTRFELSYPEKRPFFLEGNENYSTRIKQFYSRRIGEIPWGGKVAGKLGAWKFNGLLTQSDPATSGASVSTGHDALYSVFRVNRDLPRGSSIGVIGANRHYRAENSGSIGVAATLFFTDVLGMTTQLIQSHGPASSGTWTGFIRPAYDSQFSHFHIRYSHYGRGVKENMNDIGFIRHDDRKEFDSNISHTFWFNQRALEAIQSSVNYNAYWSQSGYLRSWDLSAEVEVGLYKMFNIELEYDADYKARYAPYFETDFRNHEYGAGLGFDNNRGLSLSLQYTKGRSYGSALEEIGGGVDYQILEGWNISYEFEKTWLSPAEDPEDNAWIHYLRSSYYLNKDLYFKVFYQSRYQVHRSWRDMEFDLLRKTAQVVFVWRFLPPFGSIQLAYQEGRRLHSDEGQKGRSFFTKLSWVF